MLCIISPYTSPYFNLAAEEYLLKCFQEDVFLLYRNIPSIVVGKHQNTLAEINLPFVQEQDILVARRISGGGTVFHDLGNLNFAFFTTGKEGDLVNYKRATMPIIEALGKMGLEAKLGQRNELLLKKLKISGTASHVWKKRVLHHGTLLFSSEIAPSERKNVEPLTMDRTMVIDTDQYKSLLAKKKVEDGPDMDGLIGIGAALTYLAGGQGEVSITKKISTLGKDPASDVIVDGLFVSKTAATISKRNSGYYLSYAGGWVKPKLNGKVVKESALLSEFDIITIGSAKLQFSTR